MTTRQSIVTAFLQRFTLGPRDVEAITSRDVPVNKRFFAAMDKAERIADQKRINQVQQQSNHTILNCHYDIHLLAKDLTQSSSTVHPDTLQFHILWALCHLPGPVLYLRNLDSRRS